MTNQNQQKNQTEQLDHSFEDWWDENGHICISKLDSKRAWQAGRASLRKHYEEHIFAYKEHIKRLKRLLNNE